MGVEVLALVAASVPGSLSAGLGGELVAVLTPAEDPELQGVGCPVCW